MRCAALACSSLLMLATPAHAESSVAYVDEVAVVGGPDARRGREFVTSVIQRAGFRARFADAAEMPCGDDTACLANRARREGAQVALRFTIVEVGGRIAVAMLAVDPGRTRREVAEDVDLSRPDDVLAAALGALAPEQRKPRRVAAWSLLAGSVALAAAGGLATWHAHALEARFFADHVDENGDVYGISPADARNAESHARRWSLVGGLGIAAAAVTGVGAGILFVRGDRGESRPAGVTVTMELP